MNHRITISESGNVRLTRFNTCWITFVHASVVGVGVGVADAVVMFSQSVIVMKYDSWIRWHKININQLFNFMFVDVAVVIVVGGGVWCLCKMYTWVECTNKHFTPPVTQFNSTRHSVKYTIELVLCVFTWPNCAVPPKPLNHFIELFSFNKRKNGIPTISIFYSYWTLFFGVVWMHRTLRARIPKLSKHIFRCATLGCLIV